MLETIASWFASIVGELLQVIVSLFFNLMTLDLSSIAANFPMLITGYRMFQSIGIGLIFCIAIVEILKFFAGSLTDVNDSPAQILIRAFAAGFLLWFGGYLIEMLVGIAAIPYQSIVGVDTVEFGVPLAEDFSIAMLFATGAKDAATLYEFSASTLIVLYIIVIGLIGYNIIKLLIEVVERYLMVGLLAFTSPLAFSTLTSRSTSNIFRSWLGMLCGQCVLMTLSAWMLKVIISAFSFSEDSSGMAFRLLMTFALCKIALRVDSYMQQLGIGVATTGGNLMDEAIMGMATLGNMTGLRRQGGAGTKADNQAILGDKQNSGIYSYLGDNFREGMKSPHRLSKGIGNVVANTPFGVYGAAKNIKKGLAENPDADAALAAKGALVDGVTGFKSAYEQSKDKWNDRKTLRGREDADLAKIAKKIDKNIEEPIAKRFSNFQDSVAEERANLKGEAPPSAGETGDVGPNMPPNPAEPSGPQNADGQNGQGEQEAGEGRKVPKFGGIKFSSTDPSKFEPDEAAILNNISFKNGKVHGPQEGVAGQYIADNIGALGANKDGFDLMDNTLKNPKEAESFLNNMEISQSDMNSENYGRINKIARNSIARAFDGGFENITGKQGFKENHIESISAGKDSGGDQHIRFTTTDKTGDGGVTAYDLYTGTRRNPDDTMIQAASGEKWWVKKDSFTMKKKDFADNVNKDIPMPNNPEPK